MLWPSARITLVLILMMSSFILLAELLGLVPNETKYEMQNRKQLSEAMAVMFSTLITDQDFKNTHRVLSNAVAHDDKLISAGFRLLSGRLLYEVGPHSQYWGDYRDEKSSATHVVVPMYKDNKQIGRIELRFKTLDGLGSFNISVYRLILFMAVISFFSFLFFILRTLRQIDPASTIPARVSAAFNTLSEGVVILDPQGRIVLANTAFSEIVNRTSNELLGFSLSEFTWTVDEEFSEHLFPWLMTLATGESSDNVKLALSFRANDIRTLLVNSASINDGKGIQRGVLLTFDDVTVLDRQKAQLQLTVTELEYAKKEVQRQNEELHILASRDPMTGCLNRRSFYQLFDELFEKARKQGQNLCCLMVDIDHFKRVNDNYGHGIGDEVIKFLANLLETCTRDVDIVGRYGGEEFCVVMPGLDITEAVAVAERIRLKVKDDTGSDNSTLPKVTASIGVATIFDNAKNPAELNEQADKALYVAKNSGRDQVVRSPASTDDSASGQTLLDSKPAQNQEPPLSVLDNPEHVEEINRLQTQVKQLESTAFQFSEQLLHEQHFDKLTGLPNQSLFFDRLKQAVARSKRHGKLTAVLFAKFGFFAQAYIGFGKNEAEEMLLSFSAHLSNLFRETDSVTVIDFKPNDLFIARLEGTEFALLLPDLEDRSVITWVIKRIFNTLQQPIILNNKEVTISCKLGVSVLPEDANTPEELISNANAALIFNKNAKNINSYQFYEPELQIISRKQLELESEIRSAIKNSEWMLFYQPKIDLHTSQITGVEALIRWNHPSRGILTPFEFIDLAEEKGLIVEIGEWVLRAACRQAKAWSKSGFNIKVAVNLSAVQLGQEQLSNVIFDIIKETQLKAQLLEIEVTETAFMANPELAKSTLSRLHSRGIGISLDDFGTGYSSLGYLKQLPIDTLKIDRTFIKDIVSDNDDNKIVSSVISLAHALRLKVVAEGVETKGQLDLLSGMACDEAQGYLFSKPVDADSATKLLEQNKQYVHS